MIEMRILLEGFRYAWHSLTANKLRTFLSLLGITIGIFAIITVFTVVDALEKNTRDSVNSLGDRVVFVEKWPYAFGSDYPWWKYLARPNVNVQELALIKKRSLLAESACFQSSFSRTLQYVSSTVENAPVMCVSEDFARVKSFGIAEGRFISSPEFASGTAVTVIGDAIRWSLFPALNPIGRSIQIGKVKARIIGVFEKEGNSILGNSMDSQVLIPLNFARSLADVNSDRLSPSIHVKAKDGVLLSDLLEELRGIMRTQRRLKPLMEDNFALNEVSLVTKAFDDLFDILGMAGWVIGGFSIIVGGFGIANIMFVSVRERTAQIGIQKALGARRSFILLQFLTESVLLSVAGGVLGLVWVLLGLWGVNAMFDLGVVLQQSNVVLALTISVLVGLISGFVPSYSASQLDPVEAMRS